MVAAAAAWRNGAAGGAARTGLPDPVVAMPVPAPRVIEVSRDGSPDVIIVEP